MKRALITVAAAWLAIPAAGRSAAQQPIVSSVSLIRVAVTVTDGRGRHQTGLTAADFELVEDGKAQDIRAFEEASTPLSAVLLMDASASIGASLPAAQEAAAEFIRQMRPNDTAKVLAFNTFVTTAQDATSDKQQLETAIRTMKTGGATALLNAVYHGLKDAARQKQVDDSKRPAVILLSDGDDTASAVNDDIVVAFARRSEVPVYAVRLVQPEGSSRTVDASMRLESESPGARLLSALARHRWTVHSRAAVGLKRFYADVADELHAQYRVGYISSNRKLDGRWRAISVRIKGRNNLRLNHRQGTTRGAANASQGLWLRARHAGDVGNCDPAGGAGVGHAVAFNPARLDRVRRSGASRHIHRAPVVIGAGSVSGNH